MACGRMDALRDETIYGLISTFLPEFKVLRPERCRQASNGWARKRVWC